MAGLREQKKQETRRRIILEGRRLFQDFGFEETTMEAVAEHSNISIATLYNYFPTKAGLLLVVISEDSAKIVEQAKAEIPRRSRSSLNTLIKLARFLIGSILDYDRDLARVAYVFAIQENHGIAAGLRLIDDLFEQSILDHIKTEQAAGKLRADIDPETAERVIFNILNAEYHQFLVGQEVNSAALMERIECQLRLVMENWVPKGA